MSEATGLAKRSPSLPAPPQPPFAYNFFVSPTGSASNLGTFESPATLDLARAGAGGAIGPDAKIGLRGGEYVATNPRQWTVQGALGAGYDDPGGKIIWRNYNGEHVQWINDSNAKGIENIQVASRFNWFWGIDAWRKHTDRYNYPGPGTNWYIQNAATDGVKLIHCWGHEGSNGFFSDSAIGNVELYGCGSFHAGVSTNPRAHGGYFHHTRDSGAVGSRFAVSEHISFHHLGNCMQIFASSAPEAMDDIDLLGLIAWGAGRIGYDQLQTQITIGGTDSANIPLRGFTGKFIVSWNPVGFGRANLRFYDGGAGTAQDAILEDCYLVGGTPGSGNGRLAIGQMGWSSFAARRNTMINLEQTQLINTDDNTGNYGNYVWEDNVYYGSDPTALRWRAGPSFTDRTFAGWKTFTGLGATDVANAALPASTVVGVRPVDKYEYGRGHVYYFNFAGLSRVPVDLGSFLAIGDQIVVRNAQVASPERNPGATVAVYDAPTGGNVVTTWAGVPVYFPTDGVTPPTPYGFNNPTLNAWVNLAPMTAPFFDLFIVSTT